MSVCVLPKASPIQLSGQQPTNGPHSADTQTLVHWPALSIFALLIQVFTRMDSLIHELKYHTSGPFFTLSEVSLGASHIFFLKHAKGSLSHHNGCYNNAIKMYR